jgi:alanine dehydrogenase
MIVGTVREIKSNENRVGLTPESVRELVGRGHQVIVETGAGAGVDADDDEYYAAGATTVLTAAEVFERADMIVKVKEPQGVERKMLRDSQILFTYLHLAPDPDQAHDLIASCAVCIAYETVTDDRGGLPLLKPMSQVAGRMAIQAGATALEKAHGGRGVLLGGVPGVPPGKVAVIGGGVVGFNAAQMAVGLGADVTILDRSPDVLERLGVHFEARAKTRFANAANIADSVAEADLVVGGVLVPGDAAPKVVTTAMQDDMKDGAVLVDVAIDQGGCIARSRPTTHAEPTYVVDDLVFYAVANMPGGVARTSTYALNNATLPHVLKIADLGWREAMRRDRHLLNGLNVWGGAITCAPVAASLGVQHMEPAAAL